MVEIKTVNHRYCDVCIKTPRQMAFLEDKIRGMITETISRGKVDVFVAYTESAGQGKTVAVDKQLAAAYIKAMQSLKDEFSLKDDATLSLIAGFPDVLKPDKAEYDENSLWEALKTALNTSLGALVTMRQNEGKALQEGMFKKIEVASSILTELSTHAQDVVKDYKYKLENRLKGLLDQQVTIDESRMAAEVAMFADKCNIDEEIERLWSHIEQFKEALSMSQPVGRKLDFLVQEMQREVNTIGYKANYIKITVNVLDLKGELEKIREQVQNIE